MRTGLIRNIKTYLSVAKLKENTSDILAMFGVDCFDDMTDEQLEILGKWSYDAYSAYTSAGSYVLECKRVRSCIMKIITGSPIAKKESERGMGYANEMVVVNRLVLQLRKKILYMMSYDELMSFHRGLRRMLDNGHVCRAWKENEDIKKKTKIPPIEVSIPIKVNGFIN